MAADKHEYTVALNLETSEASKASLRALRDSLSDTNGGIEQLGKVYQNLAQNAENRVVIERQLNKVIGEAIRAKNDELDKLEAERVAIIANTNLTEAERKQQLKDVAKKQAALKQDKLVLKTKEKEFKLQAKLQTITGKTFDTESKSFKLLSKTVTLQEKLNKLLSKEGTLRKTLSKVGRGGAVAAKGLGIAAGAAMAVGGAAMASAGTVYDREQALKSLKRPATPADVQEVFLNSGGRADYSTIINSINKLSNKFSGEELRAHALIDIENPGWAETILRANRLGATAEEARRVLDQIKRNTGATDLSSVMASAAKARAVTAGQISQTEYMQAHAALQGLGFDDDKIRYIINQIASKKGDFTENFNATDFSKYAWQAQQKTMIRNAGVGIGELSKDVETETPAQRAARESQRKLAEFSLKRDEMLAKILVTISESGIVDRLDDIVKKLLTPKVIDGVVTFFTTVLDGLSKVITSLQRFLSESETMKGLTGFGEKVGQKVWDWTHPQAQGGIVTTPSVVGEAGAEMVLPLNNPSRAANIVNNYNNVNNFTMSGPQTALSLSQAISNNRFIKHASRF